jgi:hypothetical protein
MRVGSIGVLICLDWRQYARQREAKAQSLFTATGRLVAWNYHARGPQTARRTAKICHLVTIGAPKRPCYFELKRLDHRAAAGS